MHLSFYKSSHISPNLESQNCAILVADCCACDVEVKRKSKKRVEQQEENVRTNTPASLK